MPATSPEAIARKTARRAQRDAENGVVQLQIRLPAALHERLRRRAFKDRKSIAGAIRDLIAAGLKPARKTAPSPEAIP